VFRQATVSLRPETVDDRPFLRDLHLSVRDEEPGFRELAPANRTALLDQQFTWQHAHYLAAFPQGWFTIVMVDDRPAGRFYLARLADCMRVIDISLLPEYRGQGIGTQLLKNVQAESVRTGLPIRLSVVRSNSAGSFYARLGFRITRLEDIRQEMEWSPGKAC
jgi:GNAT superfamily N-acetyltransferase